MKKKEYKEKYSKKVVKKPIKNKRLVDYTWVVTITILAFFISLAFSFFSELILNDARCIIAIMVILVFIGIGILFDMIGIAITVADIKTFNSMATKKVKGARLAVSFIKNSEKASSFCNDVIGDICGIISGSAGIALASILSISLNINIFIVTLVITAVIAALTIGGKALGKSAAINKSTIILYDFCKVLSLLSKK